MTLFDLTSVDRDIPDTRYYDLDNGNKVVFTRANNPFGYWTVRFEKGSVPSELNGMYTTYEQVITAFQGYLARKNEKRYTEVNMKEEPKIKAKTAKQKNELFAKE